MIERVRKYITEQRLLAPGDRIAVAVSGGADSVALLRLLLDLRQEFGIVVSVAHFHHGIRGLEADADHEFVVGLASQHGLEFHAGFGDAPVHARQGGLSLETAARELRHRWFANLVADGKADEIATAHTLDDQAETVLMRVMRGAGGKGLAGISPRHKEKALIRPFLATSRVEIEQYLRNLNQPWREDSSNRDLVHTRNRIRHELLPLLEKRFNPAIRETLADLAEIARAEAEYWEHQVAALLPRLIYQGKPSRSGRSTSGEASATWALDFEGMNSLPLALQRQVLQHFAAQLGITLEFKHIQELITCIREKSAAKRVALPGGFTAISTFRELQFTSQKASEPPGGYSYSLHVPGEVAVGALGSTIRARVVALSAAGNVQGYNPALLLDRALIESELIVRNWRAGDRYFPAHTKSPRKVKELLQPGRFGRPLAPAERALWPVIESAGQIVWLRGFPVPEAFSHRTGDAVLIEEVKSISGAE